MPSMKEFLSMRKNFKGTNIDADEVKTKEVNGEDVKIIEIGTSGTDIYGGYFQEEYLQELKGKKAADVYDSIVRSDAKVSMCLDAVKNPLVGATWGVGFIENISDSDKAEAEKQKALMDRILFNGGLDKSWRSILKEILTLVEYGYSLFEITDRPVINDSEIGTYSGLKSMAYRSQKTIERWGLERDGTLEYVNQQAFGDLYNTSSIDGRFLIHFAINKVGDNYEGISKLRPCYGSWMRKNKYLKLVAAGIEKYAIPIPILSVPAGKENGQQIANAKEALRRFVSTVVNFITFPQGWELSLESTNFDPEKVKNMIEFENTEIVGAFLANFLLLGQQGGGGSYALSWDLSDFFLGSLESIADEIVETINEQLISRMIKLNFGVDAKRLISLEYSGIRDRAGEELAKVVKDLVDSGVIKSDDKLEDFLRDKFKLPVRDDETARENTVKTPGAAKDLQFAEKKKQKVKKTNPITSLMRNGKKELQKTMQNGLMPIAEQLKKQALKSFSNNNPYKVDFGKVKGLQAYKSSLLEEAAAINNKALAQVKSGTKFKNIKLSENGIKLSEKDKLKPNAYGRIKAKTDMLAESQVADLEKNIGLQYQGSLNKGEKQLEMDLSERIGKVIAGPITTQSSAILSTSLVNDARTDFSNLKPVKKEIESYTFTNIDPQAQICIELTGRTFAADDPNVDKYQPGLHHNCESYYVINFKGDKNNPPITENSGSISNKAAKSITLGEKSSVCCC